MYKAVQQPGRLFQQPYIAALELLPGRAERATECYFIRSVQYYARSVQY